MKKLFAAAALAAMVAAVPAMASTTTTNAARTCSSIRTTMNATSSTLFAQTYGTAGSNYKNAFGRCVSQTAKLQSANHSQATTSCTTEQQADPAAFDQKYGVGPQHKGAFGHCVSKTTKAANTADAKTEVNAARQCRTERGTTTDSRQAFATKYGTASSNYKNAFGKCVSSKAKAQQDSTPSSS